MNVQCDTKTKDNVFVKVSVAVQYYVIADKVYDAFYKLTDDRGQIRSYVFDGIRSSLPKLDLDQAFSSKTEIADNVQGSLAEHMLEYGYQIINVLIVDLDPDNSVKNAMNEINAAQRLRVANAYKADTEKILLVKAAEADSESKHLMGLGIARQRKALVDGLQDTVSQFSSDVDGTSASDVMDLLLLTQYFDMVKDVGSRSTGGTMFIPHGPSTVTQLRNDLVKNLHRP
ncbi:HIR1 [Symbiodinium microadriaticum]|nr:HIR1 [Symbiodinium microadriaticum]